MGNCTNGVCLQMNEKSYSVGSCRRSGIFRKGNAGLVFTPKGIARIGSLFGGRLFLFVFTALSYAAIRLDEWNRVAENKTRVYSRYVFVWEEDAVVFERGKNEEI